MPAAKGCEELICRPAAGDEVTKQLRLFHVTDNYRRCMACAVGKCCTCFLMIRLAMNDHRKLFVAKFTCPVPDLFNERTGGVILLHLDTLVKQQLFDLQGSPEC